MKIEELDLLGAGDVCSLLEVGRTRLAVLIKNYKIPYKEISSGKVFLREDILKFKDSEVRKRNKKYKKKSD